MGNFIDQLNSTDISNTQLSESSQSCKQTATSSIDRVTIIAVDSHLGDIAINNTLNVGSIDCVLTSIIKNSADNVIGNANLAKIATLPWQLNANNLDQTNLTQIYSFQQAVSTQQCIEQVEARVDDSTLIFINTSTGNIVVSNVASIGGLSCNLSSAIYQEISNQVKNSNSGQITEGCCGCSIGMVIALVAALIAVQVAMSASKPKGPTELQRAQAIETLSRAQYARASAAVINRGTAAPQPLRLDGTGSAPPMMGPRASSRIL